MRGAETEWQRLGVWRRSERHKDGFTGFGGDSAYQEALEVTLWGSWRLCTPALGTPFQRVIFFAYFYVKT